MDRSIDFAALDALAIFPLPDIVLFPGALLPLHVFEERYRNLTADVIASTHLMAMARLRPGYENAYYQRPPVCSVIGVGRVIAADRLPDGHYNLMLRGVGRARIIEELPPANRYRVVRARLLTDRSPSDLEALLAAHRQLVSMCDQLAGGIPDGGEPLRRLVRAAGGAGACADLVGSALIRDADARQTLLETLDPKKRLEKVIEHTTALLLRFGSGPRMMN